MMNLMKAGRKHTWPETKYSISATVVDVSRILRATSACVGAISTYGHSSYST